MSETTLGIIAGEGRFPFLVADRAAERGMGTAGLGFSGFTDSSLDGSVDAYLEIKIGQLSKMLSFFKKRGVNKVVFAGGITKPKALDMRPDFRAVKMLMRAGAKGDDALLRSVAAEIESEGMEVVSPLEVLPELGTLEGVLSRRAPRSHEWDDLRFGWRRAKALGEWDIGQALMLKSRMVAAVEGMEGTDAMIRRGGDLLNKGGVVVKVCKPGQDRRLDLPAVGVDTVRTMSEAGATCLGVEAGKSLFFDMDRAVKFADDSGISVVGLSDDLLARA
jgi:hypothetical protein